MSMSSKTHGPVPSAAPAAPFGAEGIEPSASADPHAWFDAARFGLFVHFGLYSIPARHEWSMTRERRGLEDYGRYAQLFDPDRFDARDLARRARAAGMRYAVLTTKHHEGFSLFRTEQRAVPGYSAPETCGRDLVAEFVDAMRSEGLRVGFYHSLIDWSHPDFTIDQNHPLRDDGDAESRNAGRDMSRYRAHLHAQVRELLTGYGRIDYLFFDFTYPGPRGKSAEDWGAEGLLAMVRELQPECLVNDRLGVPGDLVTPEQYQPVAPMRGPDGEFVRWEACQTLNGSWGYDRDNDDRKTADLLVRMLVDSVAKNGNLLLNVGPDGRGALPPADGALLTEIADWMELHASSVHGAGAAEGIQAPPGTLLTQRGNRLYLHLATWPLQHVHLHLPGAAHRVSFARFLHDGSEVITTRIDPAQQAWNTTVGGVGEDVVTFTVPVRRPEVLLPVIEIRCDGSGDAADDR